jgi:NAD(P)-dependent dehydrogenase (short-subunit alcohol dehydrogenase family)
VRTFLHWRAGDPLSSSWLVEGKTRLRLDLPDRDHDGSVINTASTAGLVGEQEIAAYCATNGGIVMLTKQMALDYARRGVRVNCLCPGWIDTPFNAPVIPSESWLQQTIDNVVPMGATGNTGGTCLRRAVP